MHDVEWAAATTPTFELPELCDLWRNHYLTYGLSYLHQLVNTSGYEDARHLLGPSGDNANYLHFDVFDPEILSNELSASKQYSKEDVQTCFPTRSAIDYDKGPEEAWRWASTFTSVLEHRFWFSLSQKTLRDRGYVLWDSARLVKWGLLDQVCITIRFENGIVDALIHECSKQLSHSVPARRRIRDRGGRGWWSPGDESGIVWPPGGPIEEPKKEQTRTCYSDKAMTFPKRRRGGRSTCENLSNPSMHKSSYSSTTTKKNPPDSSKPPPNNNA